jgi:hypothetical protein
LVGESLMMDSMVQDSSYSLSEKSKQPQNPISGLRWFSSVLIAVDRWRD